MSLQDKRGKFPVKSAALIVGASALIFALPALGQQGPESLLPPGFNDPPPPPPPPPPGATPGPSSSTPSQGSSASSASGSTASATSATPKDEEGDEADDEEDLIVHYDIPPAGRRSLSAIGVTSETSGGFPAASFGAVDGKFLMQVLRRTNGPLGSRWGSIMARRLLVSRTITPENVNGADWVAERAALLLRMGDGVAARQLVQAVDSNRYTKRLLQVAMQAFLANGDVSGMCPVADLGAQQLGDPLWKMARPICASLAGEQGQASSLLGQARNVASGVDYRLTEKAVGAGMNGQRSVKIEWQGVDRITDWRHGLAAATGLEPPAALYEKGPRQMDGWRVTLPMLPVGSRIKVAPSAAAMGVLSNRAMVDLYAQALDDPDVSDDDKTRPELLRTAYAGDAGERIGAMESLWDGAKAGKDYQAMLVLTARAAAIIPANSSYSGSSDRLIASMMTGGFDRQAAAWADIVDTGSLGWALIAVGTPNDVHVTNGQLGDFYSDDDSKDVHRSRLLLAGLAGMDRLDGDALAEFGDKVGENVTRENQWTKAINAAAARGEAGTVALITAAAMQAPDWRGIPAYYLYHMVRALRRVGLEPEARMIAAEAVTFG